MLVRKEYQHDSRSGQQRQEIDLRRQEEEADDGRKLRERKGVRFASEVHLDDLEFGQTEANSEDRPGNLNRGPDSGKAVDDEQVDSERTSRQYGREEPDERARGGGQYALHPRPDGRAHSARARDTSACGDHVPNLPGAGWSRRRTLVPKSLVPTQAVGFARPLDPWRPVE